MNKQVKPPLVPDVNSCYFENDDADARTDTENISAFQRRERDISLYYNSTI